MKVLESKFMQDFIKMADDGYKLGWHERNGGNLSYRLKKGEVDAIRGRLYTDTPWQPIRESAALLRYWRADLAREALFWHVQQALSASNSKDIGLGFDCRVRSLRAHCAINISSPNDTLDRNLNLLSPELA